MGTPSVGVALSGGGQDLWGMSTGGGGGDGTSLAGGANTNALSTAADDDWDQFLNL
jgi:hypothetical protein